MRPKTKIITIEGNKNTNFKSMLKRQAKPVLALLLALVTAVGGVPLEVLRLQLLCQSQQRLW